MLLYRGDKYDNITDAGRYRFDGIISKAFGKGDPAYILKNKLIDLARKHIAPISADDWEFNDKSEFISFSTDVDRAMSFMRGRKKVKVRDCNIDYHETRYLFTIDIPDKKITPLDSYGIFYHYSYVCNMKLKQLNSPPTITDIFIPKIEHLKICPICNASNQNHHLLLIDVVKYLNMYSDDSTFDMAIQNAKGDKEWLVLSSDFDFKNLKNSIPRADFWSVSHFIGDGDIRNVDKFKILGQAWDENGELI